MDGWGHDGYTHDAVTSLHSAATRAQALCLPVVCRGIYMAINLQLCILVKTPCNIMTWTGKIKEEKGKREWVKI